MTLTANPVFCAVDTPNLDQAANLVNSLIGRVGGIKLGKEFFTTHGPDGVRQVLGNRAPLFLDLKFHDIPNTVANAVRAACRSVAPYMMTLHAAGGPAMMQAAVRAAAEFAPRPLLLGVTVLTSLDNADLAAIGVTEPMADHVARLAGLAQECGLDGVICSPHEIANLRDRCGTDFKLVVPGIRPAGAAIGDQKRVMTPAEALAEGADFLVIGRPITAADDPSAAAAAIAAEIAGKPAA